MDDRYDNYGNGIESAPCPIDGKNRLKLKVADSASSMSSRKLKRFNQTLMRVKAKLTGQLQELIELLFSGADVAVTLSPPQGWDGTALSWLLEAEIIAQPLQPPIDAVAKVAASSAQQTLLTVLISPDHGRDLCLLRYSELFGRRVDGVCVLFKYLYDSFKQFDDGGVDDYWALKAAEEWLATSLVKAHMHALIRNYLRPTTAANGRPQSIVPFSSVVEGTK